MQHIYRYASVEIESLRMGEFFTTVTFPDHFDLNEYEHKVFGYGVNAIAHNVAILGRATTDTPRYAHNFIDFILDEVFGIIEFSRHGIPCYAFLRELPHIKTYWTAYAFFPPVFDLQKTNDFGESVYAGKIPSEVTYFEGNIVGVDSSGYKWARASIESAIDEIFSILKGE